MKQTDFDIVVIGGGLAGLAFACALQNSNYRVLIVEAGTASEFNENDFDLRVNSIHLASEQFLDSCNVWEIAVAKRVSPFHRIQVWNSTGGYIEFSASEIDRNHLGHIVENRVLTAAMTERLQRASNVEMMFNQKLSEIDEQEGRVRLQLADETTVSCLLLVGADGGNSYVRKLSGFRVNELSYRQKAIVAQVAAAEPRLATALQKFLKSGPLAFLPLNDGTYSTVWSCTDKRASELINLDQDNFAHELSKEFDFRLGDLSLMSRTVFFDLRKLQVENYFLGRKVLIGDAAHVIHPLAGMGANLGIMDAAALAELLIKAEDKDPFGHSNLRQYERWRKSANVPVMSLMDAFSAGFSHSSDAVRSVLGTGLTLTNQVPFAKRIFMELACGIKGDLPALAKSQFQG